ncbi:F-box protein: endocytic membrane traffic, recycling ReCYcling 1, partial [Dimargaris cristalligena]
MLSLIDPDDDPTTTTTTTATPTTSPFGTPPSRPPAQEGGGGPPTTRRRGGIQPYERQVSPASRANRLSYAGKVTASLSAVLQTARAPLVPIASAVSRLPYALTGRQGSDTQNQHRPPDAPPANLTGVNRPSLDGKVALFTLPDPILLEIMQYLSIPDLFRFGGTCRYLAPLVYEPRLYMTRLVRMGFHMYLESDALYPTKLGSGARPTPRRRIRALKRKVRHDRDLQRTGSDRLRDHLRAPYNLILLLCRLFRWPTEGNARPELIAELSPTQDEMGFPAYPSSSLSSSSYSGSKKPIPVARLVLDYLHRHPMIIFRALYSYLYPIYYHFRPTTPIHLLLTEIPPKGNATTSPTATTYEANIQQALVLDQLVWFSRGIIGTAEVVDINQRLHTYLLNFENWHLTELQLAYAATDIDALRYHSDVLHLINDGTALIQILVDNHPFFNLNDKGTTGLDVLLNQSLENLTIAQWPQFLANLLTHLRDYSDLMGTILTAGRAALSFFLEKLLTQLVLPILRHCLDNERYRQSPAQLLDLSADAFYQCLEWIDQVNDLPSVGLLIDHTRGVLFRAHETFVRRHLADERTAIANTYERMIEGWATRDHQPNLLPLKSPPLLPAGNSSVSRGRKSSSVTPAAPTTSTVTVTGMSMGMGMTSAPPAHPHPVAISSSHLGKTEMASMRHDVLTTLGNKLGEKSAHRRRYPSSNEKSLTKPSSRSISTGPTGPEPDPNPDPDEPTRKNSLDLTAYDQEFHSYLSLDLALNMIHENKVAVYRLAIFWYDAPEDWRMKQDVLECIESTFVTLLRYLGQHHIKPAFDTAIHQLAQIQLLNHHHRHAAGYTYSLNSLTQYLELIHLADLIVHMVEVYYKQEMLCFVDENDFLSMCNQEKRALEAKIDDQAAAGLDHVIDVMMDQVEHILRTRQEVSDFDPPPGVSVDLRSTPACQSVLDCLSQYTTLVTRATDKHIVEVFLGEVGLRFY